MTDKELIQAIKNRDEEGLGLLIDRYGIYVSAIIERVGGRQLTAEDIEELAADVFAALWNKAETFESHREVKPWLAKTARNTTISRFRKGGAKEQNQTLSLNDDIMILEKNTTDELAVRREQQEILNNSVAALGEPDREIFARFYFLNEKIGEIAGRLQINPSTVKTKLRRSREKLREAFEKRGYTYYEN